MKKSNAANIGVWFLVAMVVVLVAEVKDAAAVTCNPMELGPCLGAYQGGGNPSTQCCDKLKEQKPCLCGYMKNPSFRPYVGSPNAKMIAARCAVNMPDC
ncbi:hypothetical protein RD792_001232 [Penstemon davidsonii]|uniref:Bifunctional inhibitor/plant lipid transfer protein/seed storage helical domain-containing protein n=1 Tax=Penstemon davidsonii TaxID=160366 RepID=A0ABR0DMV1_9LAMI|nr:hypothetical protein RD792_001232 [Penstemon davidsonii]